MKKRTIAVTLLLCLLMTVGSPVSFAGSKEPLAKTAAVISPGTSMERPASIAFDQSYSYSMPADEHTDHYFSFELPSSGKISIQLDSFLSGTQLHIHDEGRNEIWDGGWSDKNSLTGSYNGTQEAHLTKGAYYLCIHGYTSNAASYSFKMSFTSAGESFTETAGGTNNAPNSASAISIGTNYKGQIAENDEKDFYQFSIPASGKVTAQVTSYLNWTSWRIYGADATPIYENTSNRRDDTTGRYYESRALYLTKGTYFFELDGGGSTGNYNFTLRYASSGESFTETGNGTNNSIETASAISMGKTYKGQVARNDEKDFYRFSASAGKLALRMISDAYSVGWYIYDQNGNKVESGSLYRDDSSQKGNLQKTISLPSSGVYYLCIERYGYDGGDYSFSVSKYTTKITARSYTKTYGAPSFYIEATASDDETLTFSSSNSKVASVDAYSGWTTIGNPGKATITIRAQGTNASKNITVTVKPQKAALTKIKPGKRSLKATWKRDAKATGYEVVVAQNSKFTKGKKTAVISKNKSTAKTFKKLKSKKAYYVKVRAYKKSGKTKIYGAYSKVKKVKVK